MSMYFFMVGDESLNINDIKIVKSEIGSFMVPNYQSMQDAIDDLKIKVNEFNDNNLIEDDEKEI